MKATVLCTRTNYFKEIMQHYEIGEQKLKAAVKVMNIRLQRAIKNLTDDDIRTMFDELKACRESLDREVFSDVFCLAVDDFKLPITDIFWCAVGNASLLLGEIDVGGGEFAILFEMDDGAKILISGGGSREDFTDDDTIEAISWNDD